MIERYLFLSVVAALATTSMTSCGLVDSRDGSPVAARVNGHAIPVYQVEHLAAQGGGQPLSEYAKRPGARALERVIDQELLAQQARKAGLHRDPEVMQAIEAARRQILGQAYLDRAVALHEAEMAAQTQAFYRENPALFERRRIYRVLELTVITSGDRVRDIRQAVVDAENLSGVAAWLEAQKLAFNVATSSRLAEEIPLDVLRQIYQMREGQIAVFGTPRGASVVQLLRASEMPLTERQAAPVIERYLLNRKRFDAGLKEVRRLRERANIEYATGFEPSRVQSPTPPAPRARSQEAIEITRRLEGGARLTQR